MFKLSFDLPEPKKEDSKLKNRKERKAEGKVGADDLQDMFRQLGRTDQSTEPEVIDEAPQRAEKGKRKSIDADSQPKETKKQKKSKDEPKTKTKEPKNESKSETKPEEAKEPKEPKAKEAKAEPAQPAQPARKLTPMQLKMQQKLSGGRFRWINEQLYTVPSQNALALFKKSPELFNEYHTGFRHQVESWPENPVDLMVKDFKLRLQKPLNAPGGLPAEKDGKVIIADMGCGEAELSRQVQQLKGSNKSKKVKFEVHSFDLHKANERITVADIANVPLEDQSVHIVVYCLALMGTNTEDFIREALRILKPYGEIWISEIKSRFDVVNNKTETDRFVNKLKSYGLHFKSVDDSNKMFVSFRFVNLPKKHGNNNKPKFVEEEPEVEDDDKPLLKPCIYKKR